MGRRAQDHTHYPADIVNPDTDESIGDNGYEPGGPDVAVADGGTGASDATTARENLGVTSAIAALSSTYQPLDADLTAIAALTTTSTGRSLLAAANAAAIRTISGAEASGAAAAAQAASQPLDSDLTSIAALSTTSYGRALLTLANQAALQAEVGAVAPTYVEAVASADTTIVSANIPTDVAGCSIVLGTGNWMVQAQLYYSGAGGDYIVAQITDGSGTALRGSKDSVGTFSAGNNGQSMTYVGAVKVAGGTTVKLRFQSQATGTTKALGIGGQTFIWATQVA